ncbi:MAG: lysine--tRNA ligase [Candidatus Micrarchaeota archaeon]
MKESMFWADQIAREAKPHNEKHVVSDAKTPSGRIHVGSLRGVVIHDLIYKAILKSGQKAEYLYRFDDFDPMDGFPPDLPESFKKHMGEPLCNVPSPKKGFDSLAQYYALEFQEVFEKLGCKPKIVWASESYKKGKMNDLIKIALEHAETIREINEKTSGAKKESNWLPINVVCEKCGKIGTTKASDFDGKTVAYSCADVKYAKGCGHEGRISPFNGNSKLTWKVDWAAVWPLYEITIEGAGKDHYAAGGSRDVANKLSDEIFKYPHPYNFPYEFFLLGGKKMSSSKGIGVSAKEMAELLPQELLRFLLTRFKPRSAINFSPEGKTIPNLFDDYDAFSKAFFHPENLRDPDMPRIFELSNLNEKPVEMFLPQFSLVAAIAQVPSVNEEEFFTQQKGSELSKKEKEVLKERIVYAKTWLENFAEEEDKLTFLSIEKSKEKRETLTKNQLNALNDFAQMLDSEQQETVKKLCSNNNLSPQEFFTAAYLVLTGKEKGPKLMPLIKALGTSFVKKRFSETK